jgi:PHS family inorganic phosphate transporter-like MFS transporter
MGKVGAIVAQVISIPLLNKDVPPGCKDGTPDLTGTKCMPWIGHLMQIFALFMFLGLLVSFLVPETKGYTLEELAGEAPTSYNAGRNGSIVEKPKKWWIPFGGGRPAGFLYPRSAHGSGFSGRVGIMTSPELAAQNARSRKRTLWRRNPREEARPDSTSSTSNIAGPQIGQEMANSGVLPGWGVGWGRVDRGGRPLGMENIRLQDVGSLLVN